MSTDSVTAAIEAALKENPEDASLQLHLAKLYVESGNNVEALKLAKGLLSSEPANVETLKVACAAAQHLRLPESDGYRSLLAALGTQSASPNEPTPEATSPIEPVETDEPKLDSAPQSPEELFDGWKDVEAPEGALVGELGQVEITMANVAGMAEAKKHINNTFLIPMRNPEMQEAFGQTMRGGLLLWGPPGCGKTFMAKAVAGELKASFYHVGISDILDMYIGNSEKNISSIFDICRRNTPCVLFLDELDALGQKRTQQTSSSRGSINQLLMEMDGSSNDNDGVFILAASNHPWDIDAALLRPGRIDRTVVVLPPDHEARASILQFHLHGKPLANVDYRKLAKVTKGLTGADLMLVAKQATEYAMTESVDSGVVMPITMGHLVRAVRTVSPSHLPWVEAAKNYAMFNNSDGRYDEFTAWVKANKY